MIFDYYQQLQFTKSIDVVDIGNCAIRATSHLKLDYYIVIKTIMGQTSILKFGPVMPDVPMLLEGFSVNYQKIDYKESKIATEISKLINDYKKDIEEVEEVTDLEALSALPDIVDGFENA